MSALEDRGVLIRVLGPLEVVSEHGLAQLGGPKQRGVLAMLTARAGRTLTTDELVDGIWGEDAPTAVLSSIHTYISNLRTAIDQPIERRGSAYVLEIGRAQVDANVFEDHHIRRGSSPGEPSQLFRKKESSTATWCAACRNVLRAPGSHVSADSAASFIP